LILLKPISRIIDFHSNPKYRFSYSYLRIYFQKT
jgi:hypothetical protein